MRNHEITNEQALLNQDGDIAEPGWSRRQFQQYCRQDIKASKLQIKEWDYYLVLSKTFGVGFTISDEGYLGLQSVSFFNFTELSQHTETITNLMPLGKVGLPSNSSIGDTIFRDKRLSMNFKVAPGKRQIQCTFSKFNGDLNFSCDIAL